MALSIVVTLISSWILHTSGKGAHFFPDLFFAVLESFYDAVSLFNR